jgi:hypothetical protein
MLTIAGGIVLGGIAVAAIADTDLIEGAWEGAKVVAVVAGVLALVAFVMFA